MLRSGQGVKQKRMKVVKRLVKRKEVKSDPNWRAGVALLIFRPAVTLFRRTLSVSTKMTCVVLKLSFCRELDSSQYDDIVCVGPDYKEKSGEMIISAVSPMAAVDAGVLTGGCVVPMSGWCSALQDLWTGTMMTPEGFLRMLARGSRDPS